MNDSSENKDLTSLYFARLPVFDTRTNLWGYELVHVPEPDGEQNIEPNAGDADTIASDLASSTYMALQQIMDHGRKIMVNFTRRNILDRLPYALPPTRAAVKIIDPENISPSAVESITQLKDDGYLIVADWIPASESWPEVLELADMINLDVSGLTLPDMEYVVRSAQMRKARVLAFHVDDRACFDICTKAGVSFFQGSFFKQPELVSVQKISSAGISKFELMKAVEQKDPDFEKLAEIIQADVGISFRLLSYLNSASFGFRQKIQSIRDAITMLGWRNLKNWLRIALISDMGENNRHASELVFLSAQRGRFLEQVCIDHDFWGFKPDSLFLLGMFSLLDALLNQPMDEIVKFLPLADKLKAALCRQGNNEYVPLLNLAQFMEELEFDKSQTLINQLGLDTAKVKKAYHGSLEWAGQLSKMQS